MKLDENVIKGATSEMWWKLEKETLEVLWKLNE